MKVCKDIGGLEGEILFVDSSLQEEAKQFNLNIDIRIPKNFEERVLYLPIPRNLPPEELWSNECYNADSTFEREVLSKRRIYDANRRFIFNVWIK